MVDMIKKMWRRRRRSRTDNLNKVELRAEVW